ncbi:MAG TPA: hypothetical protein VMW91_10935 [Desulfosporosinus sp.]|nr:hypothetical protein [Desulfosporosinus sp.]
MLRKSLAIVGVLALLFMAIPAISAEQVIDLPITSKVVTPDRNGNIYVRFIVGETKSLNGVEYSIGTAAMCFGPVVEQAQKLDIGQNLKAIVQSRVFNGRSSYTVLKIL